MLKLIRLVAASVALALMTVVAAAIAPAAMAQSAQQAPWAVKILDPGDLYSTPEWDDSVDKALTAAGQGSRLAEIKARSNEDAWPADMGNFDKRIASPDIIKSYQAFAIAKLRFADQDAVVLYIPAVGNGHMPDGWRPATDFYIIIQSQAVAPR